MADDDIDDQTSVAVPNDVISRRSGTDTVLMSIETGRYFALEGAAGRMWELLSTTGGCTIGQLIDALQADFDVETTVLTSDVRQMVRELVDRRLLTIS